MSSILADPPLCCGRVSIPLVISSLERNVLRTCGLVPSNCASMTWKTTHSPLERGLLATSRSCPSFAPCALGNGVDMVQGDIEMVESRPGFTPEQFDTRGVQEGYIDQNTMRRWEVGDFNVCNS